MLFPVVSDENATIEFVLIWAASAQTSTQHAASSVQCHRQLIENHLVLRDEERTRIAPAFEEKQAARMHMQEA